MESVPSNVAIPPGPWKLGVRLNLSLGPQVMALDQDAHGQYPGRHETVDAHLHAL